MERPLKTYTIINLAMAGVFGLVFLYSAIYKVLPKEDKMSCQYQKKYGLSCPTCGMSRGFSLIFRGDLKEAERMSKSAVPMFCFFSAELFMRIGLGIYLARAKQRPIWKILAVDLVISAFLLTLAVHNIIFDLYRRAG